MLATSTNQDLQAHAQHRCRNVANGIVSRIKAIPQGSQLPSVKRIANRKILTIAQGVWVPRGEIAHAGPEPFGGTKHPSICARDCVVEDGIRDERVAVDGQSLFLKIEKFNFLRQCLGIIDYKRFTKVFFNFNKILAL